MVRWTTEATTTRIKGFLAYMANGEVNSWWKWRCLGQLNSQWFSFNQRCWLDFAWASICCSEIPRLLLTCAPSTRKGQWEVKRLETQKKALVLGVCAEKRTCCLRSSEVTNFWVALSIDWAWHGQALSHRHQVATPVPSHSRVSSVNAVDIVKSTFTALHYRENEGNLSRHLELLWTCHRQSSDSIKEPSHRNRPTCWSRLRPYWKPGIEAKTIVGLRLVAPVRWKKRLRLDRLGSSRPAIWTGLLPGFGVSLWWNSIWTSIGTLGLQQQGIPITRPDASDSSAIFSLLLEGPTLLKDISDELVQDSIHQSLPEISLDQLSGMRPAVSLGTSPNLILVTKGLLVWHSINL